MQLYKPDNKWKEYMKIRLFLISKMSNIDKDNSSGCIEQDSLNVKIVWKRLEFKKKNKLKNKKEILVRK